MLHSGHSVYAIPHPRDTAAHAAFSLHLMAMQAQPVARSFLCLVQHASGLTGHCWACQANLFFKLISQST